MRIVLILILFASSVSAAILASNGTDTDVQAKLNAAEAGDTITIPAGTFDWDEPVSRSGVPANVTIKGAGSTDTGGGDLR